MTEASLLNAINSTMEGLIIPEAWRGTLIAYINMYSSQSIASAFSEAHLERRWGKEHSNRKASV